MTTTVFTRRTPFSADSVTPVGLYLSLRDEHCSPCLLESNDYHSREDSKSFIGLDPLVVVELTSTGLHVSCEGHSAEIPFNTPGEALELFHTEVARFQFDLPDPANGFLCYFSFEFASLTENILPEISGDLPLARFVLFEKLIVIDHFRDVGTLFHNSLTDSAPDIDVLSLLRMKFLSRLPFSLRGDETSSQTDAGFLDLVARSMRHVNLGNVFQLVVSRRFQQDFFGDDFEIYRELRRLNPSPYLFYLDFGHGRLIGSSPETQIALHRGKAEIHPIAGTIRKTNDEAEDRRRIEQLQNDGKENAEHTMLVDMARNDLSKFSENVKIAAYKNVQQFSHVIHLVSKVTAQVDCDALALFEGTFPAGTLSGTPRPKALELISSLEPHPRTFYGGSVGFITSTGDANLAIIIRTAFSTSNTLYYQAGAGVVIDSIPENELKEVNNKLGAIRGAIRNASNHQL